MPRKIAAIGKSSRLHAIAKSLKASRHSPDVFLLSDVDNPGLRADAEVVVGSSEIEKDVSAFVQKVRPDLVVVGPEEPLAAGIVDMLRALDIRCVGPLRTLARLESSKAFTRQLLEKYGIPGNPEFRIFKSIDGVKDYLHTLGEFVVKPDGLTGGKGVKVSGEHLQSIDEAESYCREILDAKSLVIVEEKLDGEEFSYQSFFDGRNIAHTFPIQDHKRANENDTGPNTGGMGSYSFANHLLPFLSKDEIQEANEINRRVGEALLKETGQEYKGILYGGFMVTKRGLRVVEYNARFGDPEAMNVLSLLETDFVDICDAIVEGTLNELPVTFRKLATVCKYVVPNSYPGHLKEKEPAQVDVSALEEMARSEPRLHVYYGAVKGDDYRLTGSRAIAVLATGTTLVEAEHVAEKAARTIDGPVYHRRDIGTAGLIQKRLDHMAEIREHEPARLSRHVG